MGRSRNARARGQSFCETLNPRMAQRIPPPAAAASRVDTRSYPDPDRRAAQRNTKVIELLNVATPGSTAWKATVSGAGIRHIG